MFLVRDTVRGLGGVFVFVQGMAGLLWALQSNSHPWKRAAAQASSVSTCTYKCRDLFRGAS